MINIWQWVKSINPIWYLSILAVTVAAVFSVRLYLHKRTIAKLRVVILQKEAESRVKNLELKAKDVLLKLSGLKGAESLQKKEREKLKGDIKASSKKISEERSKLKKELKRIDKKSIEQLLRESKELTEATF
jgi:hypothetical protein